MKDIELAIQKEEEYIQEKVFNGNRLANIYDYLSVAGYDDLEEYNVDKFNHKIRECNITSVTDSATILQPMAYQNYQNGTPFCYFVEYHKPFALVPMSFDNEDEYAEHNLDCFKCGYDSDGGGIIITDSEDFRFCIAIPQTQDCTRRLINRCFEMVKKYYPELELDGNDFMYEGKKVGGTVHFDYNGLCMFAVNVSLVDMSSVINELGIVRHKIPGVLPHIDNMKNILKGEVEGWLRN